MSFPKVTILYSTNNLLKDIAAIDGIGGILATVATIGLIGVPKQVFSLNDAEAQGFTLIDEPFIHNQLQEFYTEVGGNQELWIMGTAETMTMAQALDVTNLNAAGKLTLAAQDKIRLLGVLRKPAVGYAPGTDFLDADVSAAVTAAKTFAQAQLVLNRPLRILIEGRIAVETSIVVFQPSTASNGYAGVVLGSSVAGGAQCVGLCLGRAVKYGAHIKVGKVANGPLSINAGFIGTKALSTVPGLEALHDKGFISLMKQPQKAGIYFGVDRMASTDDMRLLAYGRVLDKAAIITFATYVEELESEVDTAEDGTMLPLDAKHLENVLKQQISTNMGDQISNSDVIIPLGQVIIPGNLIHIKLKIQPKGYSTFITVDLGLVASI